MAGDARAPNGWLIELATPMIIGGERDSASLDQECESPTEDAEGDCGREAGDTGDSKGVAAVKEPLSGVRLAAALGIVTLMILAALAGWQGYRVYQTHEAMKQRELFVQVARQAAVNLTTISDTEVEKDVQRILDSSTGNLYDDFLKRSQPFIDVVKQAQSTSAGTVTSAGLESCTGTEAQVLVTVQVKSSNVGSAEQAPRAWRMRVNVQKVGDVAKVSNVVFVP